MPKIDWPVWILSVSVLLSTITFGVYYYFDRYNHSDQAVVEHQLQSVEAMVRENPQNPNLRVAVANYYLETGQTDQAIQQSQQALVIDPNNQGAIILLAQVYQKAGQIDDAITQFNRVIELNRDNPLAKIDPRLEMVHYELGTLYDKQGKYDDAVASLKLALEVNKTDADAHYALGSVYQKQDAHADAVAEFQEALRYIPDFVEAYDGLAISEAALGEPAKAKYAHAMVLLLRGQSVSAAAQLEELVAQSPDLKLAYFGLGLANEKLGKRDEAMQALREFIKTYPNDIAAQQALGRLIRGN